MHAHAHAHAHTCTRTHAQLNDVLAHALTHTCPLTRAHAHTHTHALNARSLAGGDEHDLESLLQYVEENPAEDVREVREVQLIRSPPTAFTLLSVCVCPVDISYPNLMLCVRRPKSLDAKSEAVRYGLA